MTWGGGWETPVPTKLYQETIKKVFFFFKKGTCTLRMLIQKVMHYWATQCIYGEKTAGGCLEHKLFEVMVKCMRNRYSAPVSPLLLKRTSVSCFKICAYFKYWGVRK